MMKRREVLTTAAVASAGMTIRAAETDKDGITKKHVDSIKVLVFSRDDPH